MSIKDKASKAAKLSAERRYKLAVEGRFDLLPPEHLTMYEHIRWKSIAKNLTDLTEYNNIWIIGTACSGIYNNTYSYVAYGSLCFLTIVLLSM